MFKKKSTLQLQQSGFHGLGFHSSKNYILNPFKEVKEIFSYLYGNKTAVNSTVLKGTSTIKNLLGNETVESFSFRTCVNPKLLKNQLGETQIVYESLTTQESILEQVFISFERKIVMANGKNCPRVMLSQTTSWSFEVKKVCQLRWRSSVCKHNWKSLPRFTYSCFCIGNNFNFSLKSF